jgi:hypothetical protein
MALVQPQLSNAARNRVGNALKFTPKALLFVNLVNLSPSPLLDGALRDRHLLRYSSD